VLKILMQKAFSIEVSALQQSAAVVSYFTHTRRALLNVNLPLLSTVYSSREREREKVVSLKNIFITEKYFVEAW